MKTIKIKTEGKRLFMMRHQELIDDIKQEALNDLLRKDNLAIVNKGDIFIEIENYANIVRNTFDRIAYDKSVDTGCSLVMVASHDIMLNPKGIIVRLEIM